MGIPPDSTLNQRIFFSFRFKQFCKCEEISETDSRPKTGTEVLTEILVASGLAEAFSVFDCAESTASSLDAKDWTCSVRALTGSETST